MHLASVEETVHVQLEAQIRGATPGGGGTSVEAHVNLLEKTMTAIPRADLRSNAPAVLVVDDVQANLISIEALLDGMACDVVLARSGDAALRQLLRREFAVILLDVEMPEMDGFEVAHHVSQNPATQEVPIVFLTAMHESDSSVLRGYGSGAVDILFKPINSMVLRSKVRVFLDLYRGRRQLAESRRALEEMNRELSAVACANEELVEQFRAANIQLAAAYQNLATTQSQLVQSAKMASLGELVAGIAHEINNPLAFVQSHLKTSRRWLGELEPSVRPGLTEQQTKHWDRALHRISETDIGLSRIADLVIKLRTFSRLDEGAIKRISAREAVESVLIMSRHRLGELIEVETRYGEPDELECYSGLLNQAIMNLVSNAIDAMPDGGRLSITTGVTGAHYAISVVDTGVGIPSDLRQRVCEPFFTTKDPGQGTGLGLSITYSIVQKHGGALDIEANGERGTRVTLRIPLKIEAVEDISPLGVALPQPAPLALHADPQAPSRGAAEALP
jgi:two-component system NtrC family sensor kinase